MGAEFRRRGYQVTTCDLLTLPNAFQHTRITCQRVPSFRRAKRELSLDSSQDVLAALRDRSSPSKWFVREYAEERMFFTPENAKGIASTWSTICRWNRLGWLTDNERKFLIASFLNCLDACANTAGTYYAYLKNWDRKALRPFCMNWFPTERGPSGVALQGDALENLSGKSFDVLYLDPPYNRRDYSRYYHLPETLAKLTAVRIDKYSQCGQPMKRATEGTSVRQAMTLPYLLNLINSVKWKRLVVQYADGAFIPTRELTQSLSRLGSLKIHKVPALGYRTTSGARNQIHHVVVVNR